MSSMPPTPGDPYGIGAGIPEAAGMRQPDTGVKYTSDVPPDPDWARYQKRPVVYADFLPRVGAYLIDNFLVAIPLVIVYLLAFPDPEPTGKECSSQLLGQVFECMEVDPDKAARVYLFCAVLGIVLTVLLIVYPIGSGGQSPGMRVLRIKVVDPDNHRPIGFGRAIVRHLVSFLSFGVCYVGVLWAIFSDSKQTWHDIAASSVVVRDA